MRLFVAVLLSDEMKKDITGTLHELKKKGVKGSYVPTANLHLTLAFIGERDDPDAVKEALKNVTFKPFKLSLSEMGSFGDTVWIGMKGNQGMAAAVRSVREALDAAGIDHDRKKFVPHITVIRKAGGKWKDVKAPGSEMMVKKISLMKTTFKEGKAVYSEIASF